MTADFIGSGEEGRAGWWRRRGVRALALASALSLVAALAACSGGGSDRSAAAGGAADSARRPDSGAADGGTADGGTSAAARAACAPDNGGITLPSGFCATIFADSVGGARHVAVAPNGDVFVQLITARKGAESGSGQTGGVLALRDTNGDGKADTSAVFGEVGGTGIGLHDGYLYADDKSRIVRWRLPAGSLTPEGSAQTIVSGLPTGGHEARNFVIDDAGNLYVNVGSRTNSCQVKDRVNRSPGIDPCTELQTRAGIWKFASDRGGQTQKSAQRFATGVRNAMGLTISPLDGKIYTTQHGRDQLTQNWGFPAPAGAANPAEELMQVSAGDDFGWPYCFYDLEQKKLVLAPEYGGDGKQVGRCAHKKSPLTVFPGHWAPMSSLFYSGTQFPARYRGGVFVAFHGSWNRAPEPQDGYRLAFVPMANGQPSGDFETFADGFAGATKQPDAAAHRPVGLAQAPDGSIYVTDDKGGRIWKVVYRGR
ncbi:MAG: PQQ-dependent sugar dehydrogenase [Gemmatimonadaceae bacterium]